MPRNLMAVAAWGAIAAVAYATLSRVGVVYTVYEAVAPIVAYPSLRAYAHFEHVAAFAIVGALFCLAYPRQTLVVCCGLFAAAALLEFSQTLTPDRHGTVMDAAEKIFGAAVGIAASRFVLTLVRDPKA
jgi:VanZ family protein